MQSKWLEEQEHVVNQFRENKRRQFPMMVGMSFFMIILFVVMGLKNGGTMSKEDMSIMIKTIVGIVVIISVTLLLAKRQNNKQGCSKLRENLEEILITQEEVNQFDNEMMLAPLHRVQLKKDDGEYYFTQHYLVYKFGRIPLTHYKIFKLLDVYSTKTTSSKDYTSVTGLGRKYSTNLCDKDGNILGSITIKKKKQYNEFIEALQRFVPDVKLGEGV